MIWAIIIIGGILVFASISSMSKKAEEAQKKAEYNDQLNTSSSAYQDYLRRTTTSAEIKAMTDNELHEYVQGNMRKFNKEKENNDLITGALGFGIWGIGIFIAISQQQWEPLILFIPAGVIAYWFARNIRNKKTDEKYRNMGFDVGRLKIEQ